jgi:hypothetical protein
MIDWLYTLPEILLMLLPATTLVALLIGLSWSLRNLLGIALTDTHVDFVMRRIACLRSSRRRPARRRCSAKC